VREARQTKGKVERDYGCASVKSESRKVPKREVRTLSLKISAAERKDMVETGKGGRGKVEIALMPGQLNLGERRLRMRGGGGHSCVVKRNIKSGKESHLKKKERLVAEQKE